MSEEGFSEGERVFAKMKGYPTWPAIVKEHFQIPGKPESYTVLFYGTYESAKVKPDCVFPYNETTKAKFGKSQKKGGVKFKKALEEIENNVEIQSTVEQPEELFAETNDPMDEEGELVIDERLTPPPPVLKKEGKVGSSSKKAAAKKEPKALLSSTPTANAPTPELEEQVPIPQQAGTVKQQRRGSKANKKDLTLALATPPEPSTPVTPQPEIVSRSGRKIKPKRFADEEVQFGSPVNAKPSPTAEDGAKSIEATPAKRIKRTSSSGSKTAAAVPAVKTETNTLPPPPPLERPKLVASRTGNSKKKQAAKNASTSASASRPPPPLLRAMPNLIPAPTSPVLTETEVETKKPEIASKDRKEEATPVPEPLPQSESEIKREDEESLMSSKGGGDTSNPVSPDDHFKQETDDEGTGKENNLQEEDTSANYENGVGEDSDEAPAVPTRMKVDLKNGASSVVLSFNHDRPTHFRNEAASIDYDMATARSVLQTKTQLEVNETSFLKTIADAATAKEENKISAQAKAEQIQKKVAQLRMEGEIVEIIGELVGSLGVKFALCDRALDLLDKLASRTDINTLALKKNPEVVDVIRKIQNYHGNVSEWHNLNKTQIEDFHVKAELIREKAVSIYQSFKLLFCSTSGKSFYDTFLGETEKFKDAVASIPQESVIGLFDEPQPQPKPEAASSGKPDDVEKDSTATAVNSEIASTSPSEVKVSS